MLNIEPYLGESPVYVLLDVLPVLLVLEVLLPRCVIVHRKRIVLREVIVRRDRGRVKDVLLDHIRVCTSRFGCRLGPLGLLGRQHVQVQLQQRINRQMRAWCVFECARGGEGLSRFRPVSTNKERTECTRGRRWLWRGGPTFQATLRQLPSRSCPASPCVRKYRQVKIRSGAAVSAVRRIWARPAAFSIE